MFEQLASRVFAGFRRGARAARAVSRVCTSPPAYALSVTRASARQHGHALPTSLAFAFPLAFIATCEGVRNTRDGDHLCMYAREPTPYSLQRLTQALDTGMDPNARHHGGWTALHVAAANNNVDACRVLLQRGAAVNEPDQYRPRGRDLEDIMARKEDFHRISPGAPADGMTALHYAALLDHEEAVAFLLEHKADPTAKLGSGHTPADCASAPAIKKLLADHTAKKARHDDEEARRRRAANPLHRRLKEHIIGQDAPIDAVSAAIRRRENGWQDEDHPLVFLFLGSSGIGKTELAKRVAEFLHPGKPEAFIRCDMSEYQGKHEVSKFIGAPPGYVGHEEGGQLVNGLRKCPGAVVLLDEVEKAHTDVLTVLLQLFDEGRLTDSHGNTVDCKDAIFVMTSNLAQDEIARFSQAYREEEGPNAVIIASKDFRDTTIRPILKAHFQRDEFLGRIHEVLYFWPFSETQLIMLLSKEMAKWATRAQQRHSITLTWDAAVLDALAAYYDIHYGARSLQHAVNIHVINLIADAHEEGQIQKGDKIHVSVRADGTCALTITHAASGGWFSWGGGAGAGAAEKAK